MLSLELALATLMIHCICSQIVDALKTVVEEYATEEPYHIIVTRLREIEDDVAVLMEEVDT